jgi:homoserine acetyltransferase
MMRKKAHDLRCKRECGTNNAQHVKDCGNLRKSPQSTSLREIARSEIDPEPRFHRGDRARNNERLASRKTLALKAQNLQKEAKQHSHKSYAKEVSKRAVAVTPDPFVCSFTLLGCSTHNH